MKSIKFLIFTLMLMPLIAGVAQGGPVENDDMNDRLAAEKFTPAARGKVQTKTVQDGEITISMVKVHNLPSGREFEVVVTVGPDGDTGFNPVVIVESDPILIGKNGILTIRDFDVVKIDVGTYRVDILIFPAGEGFPRDFISACQPAPFVTVTD